MGATEALGPGASPHAKFLPGPKMLVKIIFIIFVISVGSRWVEMRRPGIGHCLAVWYGRGHLLDFVARSRL